MPMKWKTTTFRIRRRFASLPSPDAWHMHSIIIHVPLPPRFQSRPHAHLEKSTDSTKGFTPVVGGSSVSFDVADVDSIDDR